MIGKVIDFDVIMLQLSEICTYIKLCQLTLLTLYVKINEYFQCSKIAIDQFIHVTNIRSYTKIIGEKKRALKRKRKERKQERTGFAACGVV